jgi:hypothetical protein
MKPQRNPQKAAALIETDLKRIIAYSTISQIGFIFLGFATNTAIGVAGGLLYILMHGLAKAGLFLCAGIVEQNTHCKDGCWPKAAGELGPEMPMGEGMVDFPRLIGKLKAMNYAGPLTIEREIPGEKQIEDILRAKKILEALKPFHYGGKVYGVPITFGKNDFVYNANKAKCIDSWWDVLKPEWQGKYIMLDDAIGTGHPSRSGHRKEARRQPAHPPRSSDNARTCSSR